jgi:phenylalanyl-tRNA synthetase beta chain
MQVGVFGEIHPLVRQNYDWPVTYAKIPVLAADLNLHALLVLIPLLYGTVPPPEFPPVLEDLALVVDETVPAGQVEALIRQTGGRVVAEVRLFDVYRGDQVGAGKKSLAYSLTYQASDRTLTDQEATQIRQRIVRRLQQELNAGLRS